MTWTYSCGLPLNILLMYSKLNGHICNLCLLLMRLKLYKNKSGKRNQQIHDWLPIGVIYQELQRPNVINDMIWWIWFKMDWAAWLSSTIISMNSWCFLYLLNTLPWGTAYMVNFINYFRPYNNFLYLLWLIIKRRRSAWFYIWVLKRNDK